MQPYNVEAVVLPADSCYIGFNARRLRTLVYAETFFYMPRPKVQTFKSRKFTVSQKMCQCYFLN